MGLISRILKLVIPDKGSKDLTLKQFSKLLSEEGFEVVETAYYGYLPRPGQLFPRLCEVLVRPLEDRMSRVKIPGALARAFSSCRKRPEVCKMTRPDVTWIHFFVALERSLFAYIFFTVGSFPVATGRARRFPQSSNLDAAEPPTLPGSVISRTGYIAIAWHGCPDFRGQEAAPLIAHAMFAGTLSTRCAATRRWRLRSLTPCGSWKFVHDFRFRYRPPSPPPSVAPRDPALSRNLRRPGSPQL